MEERKRPASNDHDSSAPPLKKQATSVNGTRAHPDADMPWKDDLERFTKEAILRQMKEIQRERDTTEKRLQESIKRTMYHDDHLRIIDAWFCQLLDEVKILVGQLENPIAFEAFPSTLLTADLPTFSEHLKSRSAAISSTIAELFSRSTATSPEVSELQGRIAELLAAEKGHITELERTRLERDEYIDRLEKASLRYMLAEKRLDRSKSATVAKLEKQAIFGGGNALGSGLGGGNDGSGNGQDDSMNIKSENGDDLFEAEEARKEAVAASTKQKEHIEALEAENKKLTTQITASNNRLSRLTDEDYSRTDLFKHLKSQHEDVIKRINNLEATNVQLREEAEKLQAERTAFRLQLENESQVALAEKEAHLAQAEHDLARIRTARDELIADVSMRKASQNQEKASIEQIKELANAKEERIKALESQVERLGAQNGQPNGVASPESIMEDLSADELHSRYANLERQYKMLSQELQSMGTAYTKASTLASQKLSNLSALEEKVTRLGAEKSKADQKYFAAMKSKEARDQEVRTLRAQNSKSSDIVSQLKDSEASSRALNINLEKHVAELKESLTATTNQHRTCQQHVNERNIMLEGFKTQVEDLKKSLLAKDSSASAISSAHRKVEVEIEQLKVRVEETQKSLESWKNKGLGNQSSEYEMLRTLAICTVCRIKFKDTAIKTCGHVFCKDCVEERMTSRSRKCPNCNKPFGLNDPLHVTL